MLVQFSFGNFRSFKETATLSLIAASKLQADPELDAGNVFVARERPQLSLLRTAAIYGANASGKSNIMLALKAFIYTATESANIGFDFPNLPFLFDADSRLNPVSLEMTFIHNNVLYRYGFEILLLLHNTEIISEWLYRSKGSKETVLFERSGNNMHRNRTYREGTALVPNGLLKRKDALFLSMLAQMGGATATEIVSFLRNNMQIIAGIEEESLQQFTTKCLESGQYLDTIRHLFQGADVGIVNFSIHDPDLGLGDFDDFANRKGYTGIQKETLRRQIIKDARVQAEHEVFNNEGYPIAKLPVPVSSFESQGTQKLFAFAGPIMDALANGKVLFIDEIDAKFHPLLTQALIHLFQSTETNKNNAQLIFITHDTNLLDKRRFRRDQIWFVEKDRFGASYLYSLAEFKGVRKDESFEDNYIVGKYGAIPFLGDLSRLFDESEPKSIPTEQVAVHAEA